MLLLSILLAGASLCATHTQASVIVSGSTCTIVPEPAGGDDAPSIISAFKSCSQNADVVFENETYHIESIMSTHGLKNVTVNLPGTLLVSIFILFCRSVFFTRLPVGNQHNLLEKQ
jgi:galacturan 1,4-alpha-galacturonidase